MHDMIRSISKPKFSGKPLDYAKFEADWEEVEQTFRESCQGVGQDYILLQQFKECLDEATQTRLRAREKESPRLTLTEFKRELRKAFGVDTQRQGRREWEALQLPLNGPPGRELLPQDFRVFAEKFRLLRASVPDRSDEQEWRLLY